MSAVTLPHTRFDAAFAAHDAGAAPGLIPYVTAGFPSRDDTPALLRAAQDAGCLAAEVGIPFSDPLADGPTIQRSGWRALRNGMTLRLALEQVAAARAAGVTMPLAAMTYINPVLAYGVTEFARDAVAAGLDGLIVPDLPADEAGAVRDTLHEAGLVLIPLVAPTTPPARVASICAGAGGFVYCVSRSGVTGAQDVIAPEALRLLDTVHAVTSLPRALGFGLSRPEHIEALTGRAEAAVVGSALIDALEREPSQPPDTLQRFVRRLLSTSRTA
jgi:tryptophan synthase alpha chain